MGRVVSCLWLNTSSGMQWLVYVELSELYQGVLANLQTCTT